MTYCADGAAVPGPVSAKHTERRREVAESKCCEAGGQEKKCAGYETIAIEKTERICPLCEDYAASQASKPVVVMSCEGACLRGEVARRAANILCHELAPEKTARVCLGAAFTKDTGQRNLVRKAERAVALEGCFIECASRMMRGAIPGLEVQVIAADKLYEFDRDLFGSNEMPEEEITGHARAVAKTVAEQL
jgi:uncharacterized metal-binding protein